MRNQVRKQTQHLGVNIEPLAAPVVEVDVSCCSASAPVAWLPRPGAIIPATDLQMRGSQDTSVVVQGR